MPIDKTMDVPEFSDEDNIVVLKDLLDKIAREAMTVDDVLWETNSAGDVDLKSAVHVDLQTKQLKGHLLEIVSSDTGMSTTGRIWFRNDV